MRRKCTKSIVTALAFTSLLLSADRSLMAQQIHLPINHGGMVPPVPVAPQFPNPQPALPDLHTGVANPDLGQPANAASAGLPPQIVADPEPDCDVAEQRCIRLNCFPLTDVEPYKTCAVKVCHVEEQNCIEALVKAYNEREPEQK